VGGDKALEGGDLLRIDEVELAVGPREREAPVRIKPSLPQTLRPEGPKPDKKKVSEEWIKMR